MVSQAEPVHESRYMGNGQFPLDIFKIESGESVREIMYPHWHEEMEVLYLECGEVSFYVDGVKVRGSSNDVFLFNRNVVHMGISSRPGQTIYHAIVFREDLLEWGQASHDISGLLSGFASDASGGFCKLERSGAFDDIVGSILPLIIQEYSLKKAGYKTIVVGVLAAVVVAFMRQYSANAKDGLVGPLEMELRFSRLLSYVRSHLQEKITLEEAAAMVNMSPYHFCRSFKYVTGQTFVDFVNSYRVATAERLLRTSSKTIGQIAQEVGYSDSGYFGRVFSKYRGYSPSMCRSKFSNELQP